MNPGPAADWTAAESSRIFRSVGVGGLWPSSAAAKVTERVASSISCSSPRHADLVKAMAIVASGKSAPGRQPIARIQKQKDVASRNLRAPWRRPS